jgi:hypothetical protein
MNIDSALNTLRVLASLERRGCHVIGAAVLPSPEIHITPPPVGVIHTYAYRALPRGAWAATVECVSMVDGVRVVWQQGGVRHA